MVKLLSSLSHLMPPTPSKIQSTLNSVTQSRPSLPIPNLITTVKNNPKSALAALAVVNPVVAVGVLAFENKGKIESTLGKAADTVKKEAVVVEKKTISVAETVKTDVTKVGGAVVGGIQNIYMYGMIAVGGLILLKFVI